jgi:hypothetical protein
LSSSIRERRRLTFLASRLLRFLRNRSPVRWCLFQEESHEVKAISKPWTVEDVSDLKKPVANKTACSNDRGKLGFRSSSGKGIG